MRSIFISGSAGTGKTAIALPVALKLKEEGYKVSYFKPQGSHKGPGKKSDDDSHFMKEILQLEYSSRTITPVNLTEFYISSERTENAETSLNHLDDCFQIVSAGADVLLIEGSITPFLGGSYGMDDFSLARRWESSMLHIIKAEDDFEFDNSLIYLSYAREKGLPSLGCIFNNTTEAQWDITSTFYKNIIESFDMRVTGILPRRRIIAAPTVNEFLKALDGEILAGENNLDRQVEHISVGTMTIESALKYLRRASQKAVITGGDRSDMALTALETSTSALILTGGLYPDIRVITRAEERGVPVILVHYDTFTAVEKVHTVYRTINPRNAEAIRVLKEDAHRFINFDHIKNFINK